MKIKSLIILALTAFAISASAGVNQLYQAYILKYAPIAASEQLANGVPASITLAQGLIESGAGTSSLATECNNHFGIKCGSNWNGKTMSKDDDRANECFRCYNSVAQSYEDHSLFLKRGSRYAFLFDYPVTKYKAWAYGLSRAGYATDPQYAEKLINIIETYDLAKYAENPEKYVVDLKQYTVGGTHSNRGGNRRGGNRTDTTNPTNDAVQYKYVSINGIEAVLVVNAVKVHDLANALGLPQASIIRCNEYPDKDYLIPAGDYVFLRSKKTTAAPAYTRHIVKPGESFHSISQKYGIRLSSLYKMNNLSKDAEAKVGMELILR
ncbi:MAG: glucosaminidase domain-containing protein [Paludibacteraceae bacterium]|nr:glucosaminidase domain-containing protein [Paludibacteraceae bacterium]